MGVEYQHWLLPRDLSFRPSDDCGQRLHAALARYEIAGKHEIYDIGAGALRRVNGTLPTATMPTTALVCYADLVEGASVQRLAGATLDDEPHYLQRRFLVVGAEQHVLAGAEEIFVDIGAPAVATTSHRKGLSTSHWAPPDARLEPRLRAEVPVPKELTGVFRAAVVLDFGKALPQFLLAEMLDELPAELREQIRGDANVPAPGRTLADRDFVSAIAEAFGTPIIETGFVS